MKRIPIIIDTDPGIDDALAIAIALFAPELDVRLITTVAGNVGIEHTTRNALRLLTYFDRAVPVARGASEPLLWPLDDASDVHGESGMDGFEFPAVNGSLLCAEHAVEAMRRVIAESDEPITLVPVGPLTNIALLLKMYPEAAQGVERIVMMGGSASRGNKGVMAEFNVFVDPEAAKIVFQSGVPVVMAGLDAGENAVLLPEQTAQLPSLGRAGAMAFDLFRHYRGASFDKALRMYDPTAIACLLAPDIFTFAEAFVDVEVAGPLTRGCTVVDLRGYLGREPNAVVALETDGDAFRAWFMDRLARCA